MKTRIIVAAVLLPIFFVILFFLPPIFLAVTIALILAIAAYEFMSTVCAGLGKRFTVYAVAAAAVIPFGTYFEIGEDVFRGALFLLIAIGFVEAIIAYERERDMPFTTILALLFGGAIIPYMLSVMVSLKMMDGGKFLVLLPPVATMISDSGAYFVGVFLGKHKAFKRVSPHKTIEGCAGSFLSAIIGMLIYGFILSAAAKFDVNYGIMIIYGVVGNIVTQLGDLAFSLIKRQHGIKDYGNLLPGHGGMLDRFDSMIFAAPVIYLLVTYLPAF